MLNQEQINLAIKALKNNEVVILPTDTIYGLSALVSLENQFKINKLKQAEEKKPLIILFASFEQLNFLGTIDQDIKKLFESVTPTTIILEHHNQTYALRKIQRSDLKIIIDQAGIIYSTSANVHGSEPLASFKELSNFCNDKQIKLFFDEPLNGTASKIYNSVTKEWIR